MNSLLFDYILNYLTPKEYRLELKNRLENLCSLSGQTMSPGLTKWLEKTFGIEMVRVIQDYANLGGNKFPPDYLEKINRLVPGNYKGYNANQGFRQLFDVSCGPQPPSPPPAGTFLWVLSVYDTSDTCFSNPLWDFDGNGTDFSTIAASFGGYYVQDGIEPAPYIGITDTCSQVSFIYQGAIQPPDINYYDPNSISYVTAPFIKKGLNWGCISWPSTRLADVYDTLLWNGWLITTFASYGGDLDFNNDFAGSEARINALFKSYMPDSSVQIIDDGGGFFTINFNYVWYDPGQFGIGLNFLTYNFASLQVDYTANTIICP